MRPQLLVMIALLLGTSGVQAQSLFGTRGLGVPLDAVDPRSRALGNVGLGLLGLNASMANPAELGGILRRGVFASLQPFYGAEELAGAEDNVAGSRFPLIQLMYPARQRLVLALGFGGVLEQTWSVFTDNSEIIGNDTLDTRDRVSASGAISQVRLSAAYELTADLSVGLAVGIYAGGLERAVDRTFADSLLRSFTTRRNWDYRGPLVSAGVRFDPSATTRLSGAVTWSGELDARQRDETGSDYSYDMPLRVALGASTLITPRLLVTASGQWSSWSDDGNYAAPGSPVGTNVSARTTLEVGGGLEWEQLRSGGRVFPLRAGFRYAQLPFFLPGDETANEIAGSLGVGLRLASDQFGPLAVGDIAVERGKRSGWEGAVTGGLTENFWRIGVSIALFGR